MDELKPCPFCGGEAHIFNMETLGYSFVRCGKCGIGTPSFPWFDDDVSLIYRWIKDDRFYEPEPKADKDSAQEKAIAAWNRRVDNV